MRSRERLAQSRKNLFHNQHEINVCKLVMPTNRDSTIRISDWEGIILLVYYLKLLRIKHYLPLLHLGSSTYFPITRPSIISPTKEYHGCLTKHPGIISFGMLAVC